MLYALDEALDFNNRIGKSRIERRIKALAARLKQELAKIPGVKVHTPVDPYLSAGLTAFSMGGASSRKLVDYLREKYNLVVRTTGSQEAGTYGVRVSTPDLHLDQGGRHGRRGRPDPPRPQIKDCKRFLPPAHGSLRFSSPSGRSSGQDNWHKICIFSVDTLP